MPAGRGAVEHVAGDLPGGIDLEDAPGLWNPTVLTRAIDISIGARRELRRPGAVIAFKAIDRVSRSSGSYFEDGGQGGVGGDSV